MKSILAGAGIVALVVIALACGNDESPEEATAQLCSDMAELNVAVLNLKAITDQSTVNDLEQAQDDFQNAAEDVKTSAENVADARVDDLSGAQESLSRTVSNLEGDQTIASAEADVQTAIASVAAGFDQLNDSVNCPSST